MQIQQPVPGTRLIVEYLYVDDAKETKQICLMDIPSAQPIPKVGDEISIPKGMEELLGTTKTIFRVLKRRFPIQPKGLSQSKVQLFVSSDLEQS